MPLLHLICLILSIIVYYSTEFYIFSFLSDIKFPFWKLLLLMSFAILINQIPALSPLLIDPILFLVLLKLEKRKIFSLQSLFIAFFPSVFVDLFSRFLITVVLPYIFLTNEINVGYSFVNLIVYLLVFPMIMLVDYFVGHDYKHIFKMDKTDRAKNFYSIFIIFMLAYYVDIFLVLGFVDPFIYYKHPMKVEVSYKILFFSFTLLFLYLLSYFNHKSKAYMEEDLKKEQDEYIQNLESYGHHLECLYKDGKEFQVSYLKRLDKLGQAIEKDDLDHVRLVYYQIVDKANQYWDQKHYNIAKLGTVSISSVKSLLSAKIIEAEQKGLGVALEVPDNIYQSNIPELDFLLLISIFFDNAIEAAQLSKERQIAVAYFTMSNKQYFVIENSTLEKQVDISAIFEDGYSTKGTGRGIGLVSVENILKKYPLVTLATKSADYQFSHVLTIPEGGEV
ncbi:GHKL domain-containing protein [Streptococcus hongkongensis]|nr:histidine kinase [Streptococcus uberis]